MHTRGCTVCKASKKGCDLRVPCSLCIKRALTAADCVQSAEPARGNSCRVSGGDAVPRGTRQKRRAGGAVGGGDDEEDGENEEGVDGGEGEEQAQQPQRRRDQRTATERDTTPYPGLTSEPPEPLPLPENDKRRAQVSSYLSRRVATRVNSHADYQ